MIAAPIRIAGGKGYAIANALPGRARADAAMLTTRISVTHLVRHPRPNRRTRCAVVAPRGAPLPAGAVRFSSGGGRWGPPGRAARPARGGARAGGWPRRGAGARTNDGHGTNSELP